MLSLADDFHIGHTQRAEYRYNPRIIAARFVASVLRRNELSRWISQVSESGYESHKSWDGTRDSHSVVQQGANTVNYINPAGNGT